MTSNSIEVLLHNLSSQFKSFRLELISAKNMHETLVSYSRKVPSSIAHFFRELQQFFKSLQQSQRRQARHHSVSSHIRLSNLNGYGESLQSPMQRSLSGRGQLFQTCSGMKTERNRQNYFSKTLGSEELRAFQTEAKRALNHTISRTTTYEEPEQDDFESRIKTTPIRIRLDEVSDFQNQIQTLRPERAVSQSLVLDGTYSLESTVINSRKATSPLRVETNDSVDCESSLYILGDREIPSPNRSISLDLTQYEFNKAEAPALPLTPKELEWMPNSQSKRCLRCQANFGIFNWRHHCRNCGELVCGSCSKGREYVQGYPEKVKVCSKCQALIKQRRAEAKRQGKATLHLCRITEEK